MAYKCCYFPMITFAGSPELQEQLSTYNVTVPSPSEIGNQIDIIYYIYIQYIIFFRQIKRETLYEITVNLECVRFQKRSQVT